MIFNDTNKHNKAETDEKTINNAIEEIFQDRETNSVSQQLQALNTLLDSYLSPLPSSSSDTTSISLNIEAYTSFTHHPFYAECKLELPDDKVDGIYLNLPIDSLMSLLVSTLHDGHTVIWEGDISERGFSQQQGLALLSPDISTTQASRQKEFENKKTTDDHVMHIVGIATNEEGKRFFLAKNSWGKSGRFRGYIFLSEEYVKLKTIALYCATNNKPNQKQNTYNINFSYTTK